MLTPIEIKEVVNELNTQLKGTWTAISEMQFSRSDGFTIYIRLAKERYEAGFCCRMKGQYVEVYEHDIDPTSSSHDKVCLPTITTARKLGVANLVRNFERRVMPLAEKVHMAIVVKTNKEQDRAKAFTKAVRFAEAMFQVSEPSNDKFIQERVRRLDLNIYRSPLYEKISGVLCNSSDYEIKFRIKHDEPDFLEDFLALIKKYRG